METSHTFLSPVRAASLRDKHFFLIPKKSRQADNGQAAV